MGEVYRVLDTQLERQVAIQVLPRALAHSDREAKILAAVNHPRIYTLHGSRVGLHVEDYGGRLRNLKVRTQAFRYCRAEPAIEPRAESAPNAWAECNRTVSDCSGENNGLDS